MGLPAAKKGDSIVGVDIHVEMVPPNSTPTPLPNPFSGTISDGVSSDVKIMGQPAAIVGSIAKNNPPHIPKLGPFQKNPANQGEINKGSSTVKINGEQAARAGDTAMTCNDPEDLPNGVVIATGTVFIGG